MLYSGSLIITKVIVAFDNNKILCETRVKLIRDDYELKTSQRRHELRDIINTHSKKLPLYST